MKPNKKVLGAGATVFLVLAWLSLLVQVGVGIMVLVVGGDPVLIGGVEVPARLVGVLNCIGGAVYFFLLLLVSHLIRLLLDLHIQLGTRSAS